MKTWSTVIHCSKWTAEYSNENMCSCSKFHIIKTWQVMQYFFTITFRPESTPDQYNRLYKEFIPMPLHPKDERFCTFHDIFIGGRSCLYYAEIWSKVKKRYLWCMKNNSKKYLWKNIKLEKTFHQRFRLQLLYL